MPTLTFPFQLDGAGNQVVTLSTDWKVGDCHLAAGTTIQFRTRGSIEFFGEVHTTHPQFLVGDTWHNTFRIRSILNCTIRVLPDNDTFQHDLDNMQDKQVHYFNFSSFLAFDATLLPAFHHLEWTADC
jgi:hypothetical protein